MATRHEMPLAQMARRQTWVRLVTPQSAIKSWVRRQIAERNDRRSAALIERRRGKLPESLRRQVDEYAREVLGHRKHALGLYVYTTIQQSFKEGWIPFSYYRDHVLPVSYRARELNRYRHFLRAIVSTEHVPDIAYVLDGRVYNVDFTPLTREQAKEVLFGRFETVIFKRNRSRRGLGVCKVTRSDFDATAIEQLPDGVFQEIVSPHEAFSGLLPDRGPTVRILTTRGPDGTVTHRASYLRVARECTSVVQASNQVGIAIERSTGRLHSLGYASPAYEPLSAHPDTGCRFEGLVIPMFVEIANEMVRYHELFPLSDIIGWDICIDREGQPRILEWNIFKAGIDFVQAAIGPVFEGLGWQDLWRR